MSKVFFKNTDNKILSFFILLITQVVFIALTLIFIFQLNFDDLIKDSISELVKSIYFTSVFICLIFNLHFFSEKVFSRILDVKNKMRNLLKGFTIGFLSISSYYIILIYYGYFNFIAQNFIFSKLLEIIVISFFIGFIEELVFRDFLLREILKKHSVKKSIIYSSLVYAILHFLRFDLKLIEIIIPIMNLFLIGIILSKSYIKNNIFNSIGIHWSWVLAISYINQVKILDINHDVFLTGGLYPPFGILVLFFLALYLVKK